MARRRYVLQVVVDVFDAAAPVSTDTDEAGFLGGMPLLLTNGDEADGYVKSITILDTKEL